MIDKNAAPDHVTRRIKRLPSGSGLELRTFKRDRMVRFTRLSETMVLVEIDGFSRDEFEIQENKTRKTLLKLLKKEFPRSNKIRISEFTLPGTYTGKGAGS